MESETDALALMESLDTGKPISDARNVDIPLAIQTVRWYAEALDKVYGEVGPNQQRSEEHTSELQSLMRSSYAVFCLKKKHKNNFIFYTLNSSLSNRRKSKLCQYVTVRQNRIPSLST